MVDYTQLNAAADAMIADAVAVQKAADAAALLADETADAATLAAMTQQRDDALAEVKRLRDKYEPVVVPPKPTVPALVIGGAYLSNADPAPLEARGGVKMQTRRTYHSDSVTAPVSIVKANIAAGRRVSHLSFKRPSWALAAAGADDAWAQDTATKLAAAVAGTDHLVRVAVNHEPENDTGTNVGGTAAGRDQWKAMQAHLAPFFDKPGLQYVIVLMGYHSFNSSAKLYPLWNLDACIPDSAAIKGIGYDIYESRHNASDAGWLDWQGAYFSKIKAWHTAHGKAWGLSETGITAAAFAERPTWFTDLTQMLVANGGSWFDYFNTNLNSTSTWAMTADDAREKAFVAAVKANQIYPDAR